ncbi:MAG: RDD family protein [Thermoproteota archaeon]
MSSTSIFSSAKTFLVLFWFYLTLLEGFSGQSLGKVFMQIKVVRVDGKKLTYDRVAIRNFGKVFLLPVDLLLAHYFLKEKMYLRYFDKFAGTTVIEAIQ